jgi:hypothetical protein
VPKQHHVPETKDVDLGPNREQRRHPERAGQPEDEPLAQVPQLEEQDAPSVRAKSSGHRKKTADKWNQ